MCLFKIVADMSPPCVYRDLCMSSHRVYAATVSRFGVYVHPCIWLYHGYAQPEVDIGLYRPVRQEHSGLPLPSESTQYYLLDHW